MIEGVVLIMIVETMTTKEALAELHTDVENVYRFMRHQMHTFRRMAIKARALPIRTVMEYKSPKNNLWLLCIEIASKKYVLFTFTCVMNVERGRYCYNIAFRENGERQIHGYPPHFFHRYGQRMKLQDTGLDLIKRYFKLNGCGAYDYTDDLNPEREGVSVHCATKEGVAMGVRKDGIYVMKTFITYDMAKGQQAEKFAERAKELQKMDERGWKPQPDIQKKLNLIEL